MMIRKTIGKVVLAASVALTICVGWSVQAADDKGSVPDLYIDVRSVEKTYDGIATNILVVSVTNAQGEAVKPLTLKYGESESGPWTFTGVTNVTNGKKVYVYATAEGYKVATSCAFVTINPLDQTKGPNAERNGVFAEDKTITYKGTFSGGTYRVGKGFVPGDGVKEVYLALTNRTDASKLAPGVYEGLISTNASKALLKTIVVTNTTGDDVTGNYKLRFTPGTLIVGQGGMTIGPGSGDGPEMPVTHPPAGKPSMPPADPNDKNSWTNGARSVVKVYDGNPTNIIVYVKNPSGGKIKYSYSPDGPFSEQFAGYVNVTNLAPVWYEASDPSGNYRSITNCAFVTINPPQPPVLVGSVKWHFDQSKTLFYAAVDAACIDGDPAKISNLAFIYEDRGSDYYLADPSTGAQLSANPATCVYYGGKRFGRQALDAFAATLRSSTLGTTNRCGVSDATMLGSSSVPDGERKIAISTTNDVGYCDKSLGYLTWQETGSSLTNWCALGEGVGHLNEIAPKFTLAPLTRQQANRLLAFGLLALTEDSDPTLSIGSFEIDGSTITCSVVTSLGGQVGVPGSNVKVEIEGAATLAGPFNLVAMPTLDSSGRFSFDKRDEVSFFFRVRLKIIEVIK